MVFANFQHIVAVRVEDVRETAISAKAGIIVGKQDLLARGIKLIPSATAQLASRSKVFQAKVFEEFMLPGTQAVYDNHTLLDTSSLYQKLKFTKVILKCDRKNAGLGIHLFNTIEELYNLVVCGKSLHFPFVIQPFRVV